MHAAIPMKPASMIPHDVERLFQEHHQLVFRTALRITGNSMDAEDVLQTLFVRLLRRESAPDLREGARGYFHRAAVNLALDIVRKRGRSTGLESPAAHQIHDSHPQPDEAHTAAELRSWLRSALANLDRRAAEMFALRYLQGCSNGEIARLLGTSWGTVAVTLFRTRSRLRKEIGSFLGGKS